MTTGQGSERGESVAVSKQEHRQCQQRCIATLWVMAMSVDSGRLELELPSQAFPSDKARRIVSQPVSYCTSTGALHVHVAISEQCLA